MSNSLSFLNQPSVGASSSMWSTPVKARASAAAANSAAGAGSASATSQTSLTSLGNTFLKLLTQELQNQDPTAPMDSTQMVGQMISLNQLDQLASINQLLTTQFGGASGSGASATSNVANSSSVARNAALAALNSLTSSAATL